MSRQPAIFLDRDGTLNRDPGFVHRVADLELLPHVVPGLSRLAALGYALLIVSNQSGVARGYFSESDVQAFNAALCHQLAAEGVTIAGVYYCPFHPAGQGDYRLETRLRKPGPGMIEQAAREHDVDLSASFVIGDKSADVAAGQAAGCRTILIRAQSQSMNPSSPLSPRGRGAGGEGAAPKLAQPIDPDHTATDLLDAAYFIQRVAHPSTGQDTRASHSKAQVYP